MKRRTLALIFTTFMLLAVTGCSSSDSASSSSGSTTEAATSTSQESTNEDVSKVEGDLGDYHVRIKKGTLTKDYEGNDVLRVVFKYTNNSEDSVGFDTALYPKAFQDGVELESAYFLEDTDDDKEFSNSMKSVRPGTTIDCAQYWLLDNTDSPVELEVSELVSLSDKTVQKTFTLQ